MTQDPLHSKVAVASELHIFDETKSNCTFEKLCKVACNFFGNFVFVFFDVTTCHLITFIFNIRRSTSTRFFRLADQTQSANQEHDKRDEISCFQFVRFLDTRVFLVQQISKVRQIAMTYTTSLSLCIFVLCCASTLLQTTGTKSFVGNPKLLFIFPNLI